MFVGGEILAWVLARSHDEGYIVTVRCAGSRKLK